MCLLKPSFIAVHIPCINLKIYNVIEILILNHVLFAVNHHHHHRHHQSFMELGHLLTRSGLMHPEVSLTVCHDFFCQLGNIAS